MKDILSKEDFINKHTDISLFTDQHEKLTFWIELAMDEYAEIMCLNFERFLVKNYIWVQEQGWWYNKEIAHEGAQPFDREELYAIFLEQSKQK